MSRAGKLRTRRDPRKSATSQALIEGAEALIALHGIEGASVRQIGASIGSGNNNVVSYHFGTKEALIEAIYRHRLPALDARRAQLLSEAEQACMGDTPAALLRALWLPFYEQRNQQGWHSYARFLLALSISGWGWTWDLLHGDLPTTEEITARLKRSLPAGAAFVFEKRMIAIFHLVAGSLAMIDQMEVATEAEQFAIFSDCLAMCSPALHAEVPNGPDKIREENRR